jgi:uncharacterized SAM-binding protein YcdF (DUF218 family)
MFFVFSKLIGFLSSPFWWILIFLGAGWIVKSKRIKRYLYAGAFIVFLLFTNPLFFRLVSGMWEGDLQDAETMRGKSDVCVVLGGMSAYHEPTGRIRFTQSADRILQAVDLYEKGIVKKIVITGGTGRLIRKNRPEAIHLKDFLVAIGIPDSSVLIDAASRNTYENAVNTKKLLVKNGWGTSIVLVTSGFHMKRAKGCFEKEGFKVYPYIADPLKGVSKVSFADIFMPSAGVLNGWNYLTHEWIGIVMYKLKGYM